MNKEKFHFNRVLPYNILAEKIILGSILVDPDAIGIVSQYLSPEAFYVPVHQLIYTASLSLYGKGITPDYVSLISYLQDRGLTNKIEDLSIIAEFISKVVTLTYLEDYIDLVYDKYLRRRLINLGEEIINQGFLITIPFHDLIKNIEKELLLLDEKKKKKSFISMAQGLNEVLEEIRQRLKDAKVPGLLSSFSELDNILHGFQKSDLIILAGRPGMGKTAFAFCLAKNIAIRSKIGVAFFSLEMTHEQLMYRILSSELKILSHRLKSGVITKTEWLKLHLAIKNLSKLPIYIHDSTNLKIDELQFRIKKLEGQKSHNLGFIIIDYLQLIEIGNKSENRAQELGTITRRLKKLARDLNIPILVISQLSRNVETRINKRPYLSDLRDSGCFNVSNVIFQLVNFYDWTNKIKKQTKKTLSWNGKSFIVNDISNIQYTGYKPIYIVKTNLEWSLVISSNHKVFTQIGWKRTDQLSIGDQVFLKLNLPNYFFYLNSISWVIITKIDYFKNDSVYDLEISNLSNFLTNRILLHNSIEQDADVVLMLYREEYYNSSTLNKNIIEIIVAKHRNGPIGTAKLKFDSNHLRFQNL